MPKKDEPVRSALHAAARQGFSAAMSAVQNVARSAQYADTAADADKAMSELAELLGLAQVNSLRFDDRALSPEEAAPLAAEADNANDDDEQAPTLAAAEGVHDAAE